MAGAPLELSARGPVREDLALVLVTERAKLGWRRDLSQFTESG